MVQPDKEELIRKRVLYIGSAVPLETAEGLEGIQKPLLERFPTALDEGSDYAVDGIEAYLSVVPSGIILRYLCDMNNILFFPISSLTLCAAVRCVTNVNQATGERTPRFMSISSPAAKNANNKRPAIFTTITRRTEGRKVLECHGFICFKSEDALELVQVTSYADRLSKGKINGATLPPAVRTNLQREGHAPVTPRSFETNTLRSTAAASTSGISAMAAPPVATAEGEHPVRLVAGHAVAQGGAHGGGEGGNNQQRVAPEFYEPPPPHGYFYKTADTQIKTYTVEKMIEGKAERLRAISPHAPANASARSAPPTGGVPVGVGGGGAERRHVYSVGGGVAPGPGPHAHAHHHPHPHPHPAGGMTLPYPPGRPLIPVRAIPPSATLIRPRFFSPPPPLLRPRPMMMPQVPVMPGRDPYVFLPPPPHVVDAPYFIRRNPPTPRPRGGSGTSSDGGSSRSSSGSRGREVNGRRVVNGDGGGRERGGAGEGSSDGSYRPRTPPTDYERGPRVSRKEQFDRSQRYLREVNGAPPGAGAGPVPPFAYATLPGGGAMGPPHHPYDFYMYPPPHPRFQYGYMPPYMMERARSVPAPMHRGKSQERGAGKKSHQRKAKKEKKKKAGNRQQHRHPHQYVDPSDISTDSVGYASEVLPGGADYPRMPRDFRRFENQFKHERAFSKSLAEEGVRGGPAGVENNAANAYSLNEHMAQRGGAQDTDGFTLY